MKDLHQNVIHNSKSLDDIILLEVVTGHMFK